MGQSEGGISLVGACERDWSQETRQEGVRRFRELNSWWPQRRAASDTNLNRFGRFWPDITTHEGPSWYHLARGLEGVRPHTLSLACFGSAVKALTQELADNTSFRTQCTRSGNAVFIIWENLRTGDHIHCPFCLTVYLRRDFIHEVLSRRFHVGEPLIVMGGVQ